jgi:hypothetical protein
LGVEFLERLRQQGWKWLTATDYVRDALVSHLFEAESLDVRGKDPAEAKVHNAGIQRKLDSFTGAVIPQFARIAWLRQNGEFTIEFAAISR